MTKDIKNLSSEELMKSVIQRVATGPELSKNISREEHYKVRLDGLISAIKGLKSIKRP